MRSTGHGGASCWGVGTYGESKPPAPRFSEVSAGPYHTCGVAPDWTAACWGDNSERTGYRRAGWAVRPDQCRR